MNESISIDPDIPERTAIVWDCPKPTCLMVYLHGGGLWGGDPADIGEQRAALLNRQGCIVISLGYRCYPQAQFPEYLEDCASGTEWATRRYPGLPLIICGKSAGGWLAGMLASDSRWLVSAGLPAHALSGVIPISGQMTTHCSVAAERQVPTRGQDLDLPDHIRQSPWIDLAAPLFHAGPHPPPWLAFVGSADIPCRLEENRLMVAALTARGHLDADCIVAEGCDHSTIWGPSYEASDGVMPQILAFVQRLTDQAQVRGK